METKARLSSAGSVDDDARSEPHCADGSQLLSFDAKHYS